MGKPTLFTNTTYASSIDVTKLHLNTAILYNTSIKSMSVSTDTSTYHDEPQPIISSDFFEFDFVDSNSLAGGDMGQDTHKKRGRSKFQFGIAVDPEEEFRGRENYDFFDACLASSHQLDCPLSF